MNQALNAEQIKKQAANQWHNILIRLGVDATSLDGKHHPCPSCGGTDRFRFDNKGCGAHICSQCGAGDGFTLIMKVAGCTFPESLQAVSEILGLSHDMGGVSYQTPPKPAPAQPKAKDKTYALRKIWGQSQPLGGIALEYLKNRGLKLSNSPALRFHASLAYYGNAGGCQGHYKALIALVQDVNGQAVGIHRTYLTEHGHKAPLPCPKKLMVTKQGATRGAAIRLCNAGKHLLLAEGIETALAVHDATGLPVWACISAHGLKSVLLPPEVERVTICADKDRSKVGEEAAEILLHRLVKQGLKVAIVFPPSPIPKDKKSVDFADMLEVVA